MSQHNAFQEPPDDVFIAAQKRRLEALRDELIGDGDAAGENEERLAFESVDEVRDDGDSAETMAMEENDEAIFRQSLRRLADVRRALEKLAAGTYGLSDITGLPIPRGRLQAMPEAVDNIGDIPGK